MSMRFSGATLGRGVAANSAAARSLYYAGRKQNAITRSIQPGKYHTTPQRRDATEMKI